MLFGILNLQTPFFMGCVFVRVEWNVFLLTVVFAVEVLLRWANLGCFHNLIRSVRVRLVTGYVYRGGGIGSYQPYKLLQEVFIERFPTYGAVIALRW